MAWRSNSSKLDRAVGGKVGLHVGGDVGPNVGGDVGPHVRGEHVQDGPQDERHELQVFALQVFEGAMDRRTATIVEAERPLLMGRRKAEFPIGETATLFKTRNFIGILFAEKT